jgi:serine protein kinase
MMLKDDVFSLHAALRDQRRAEEFSLAEYLAACRDDPRCYASPAERMLHAIGEPELVDTSRTPRLGRIFLNRTVRIYSSFSEFHGMEETIERIVSFFRHAAQGLEERKQVLYLLGPVGGGKSSLGERLKAPHGVGSSGGCPQSMSSSRMFVAGPLLQWRRDGYDIGPLSSNNSFQA